MKGRREEEEEEEEEEGCGDEAKRQVQHIGIMLRWLWRSNERAELDLLLGLEVREEEEEEERETAEEAAEDRKRK